MRGADAAGVVLSEIRELLVFGDSLSDGGNARAALGDGAFSCPPHWNNRRCDGPLWVDHLASGLGLPPLLPSLHSTMTMAMVIITKEWVVLRYLVSQVLRSL